MLKKHLPIGAAILLIITSVTTGLYADGHGKVHGTLEEAKKMVADAIAYFNEVGAEAAFAKFTNDPEPEFRKGDLYVFVLNKEGVNVAYGGAGTSPLGHSVIGMKDPDGTDVGKMILDAATMEGGWANYKWLDPVTNKAEPKSSWVVLHKGYIFGVGVYEHQSTQ